MTFEEYEKSLNEVLQNPDTALANISGIMENLKTDLTNMSTLLSEKESLEARIKDLQDTNMKLYLSMNNGAPTSTEEEEEPAEGPAVIDEFISEVFKDEKEGD